MKEFLVQQPGDNGEVINKIFNEAKLIRFIDMLDCSDISTDDCRIYLISEIGNLVLCCYTGWQQGNLIEIEDQQGNIVASGYGTDH